MAPGGRTSKLCPMNEPHLTLTLEIEATGDHLAGRVTGQTGSRREFVGRIGLMCAIDAFVAEDADAITTSHKEPQ